MHGAEEARKKRHDKYTKDEARKKARAQEIPANKKQMETWYDFGHLSASLGGRTDRGEDHEMPNREDGSGHNVHVANVLPPFPMGRLMISIATSQTTRNRGPPLPLAAGFRTTLLLISKLPEAVVRPHSCSSRSWRDHTTALPAAPVTKLITRMQSGIPPLSPAVIGGFACE